MLLRLYWRERGWVRETQVKSPIRLLQEFQYLSESQTGISLTKTTCLRKLVRLNSLGGAESDRAEPIVRCPIGVVRDLQCLSESQSGSFLTNITYTNTDASEISWTGLRQTIETKSSHPSGLLRDSNSLRLAHFSFFSQHHGYKRARVRLKWAKRGCVESSRGEQTQANPRPVLPRRSKLQQIMVGKTHGGNSQRGREQREQGAALSSGTVTCPYTVTERRAGADRRLGGQNNMLL